MRVDTALLCDWVTVREGLLNILGGGITRLWRDEYPAPLGAALALRVVLHPTETKTEHEFQLLLLGEDGATVADLLGKFGVGVDEDGNVVGLQPGGEITSLQPGEEVAIAIPITIVASTIGIPSPGAYSFELLIDGVHQTSVPFLVARREGAP